MISVLYHEDVIKFFKKLEKPARAKVLHSIELLERYGQNLTMPHVKKINTKLFELRVRGSQEVRIFYFIQSDCAILIHGFVKKTQKTPYKEIATVQNRFNLLTKI